MAVCWLPVKNCRFFLSCLTNRTREIAALFGVTWQLRNFVSVPRRVREEATCTPKYLCRPHTYVIVLPFECSLDYDNNSCVDNTRGNIRTLSETRAKTRNVIDKKHYVRLAMRGLQGTFTLRAQNADCRLPRRHKIQTWVKNERFATARLCSWFTQVFLRCSSKRETARSQQNNLTRFLN